MAATFYFEMPVSEIHSGQVQWKPFLMPSYGTYWRRQIAQIDYLIDWVTLNSCGYIGVVNTLNANRIFREDESI